jgi:hypothetical protein
MALTYIWSTLPENAKTRLKLASAQTGRYEDVNDGAIDLINILIQSGLKTTQKYSLDLIKDPNATGSGSSRNSSSGSGDNETDYGGNSDKTDPYTNMIKMMGGTEIPLVI